MGIQPQHRVGSCAVVVCVRSFHCSRNADDAAHLSTFRGAREQLVLSHSGTECNRKRHLVWRTVEPAGSCGISGSANWGVANYEKPRGCTISRIVTGRLAPNPSGLGLVFWGSELYVM